MPTYGYECTACSDKFETVQSIKDAPLTVCEKCGGSLKKLIYPIGIAFKGSGFYVNDYAKKSDGGGSKSSGATSETKSETKTETTTETKTETKSESTTPAAAPATAAA